MKRTMRRLASLAAGAAALTAGAWAHGGHEHHDHATAFEKIAGDYEAIRLALVDDSLDSVSEKAKAIAKRARLLSRAFDPEEAGVEPESAKACRELLPQVQRAAEKLAAATELEPAREAFGELSDVLIRYRALVHGERPAVAYCPMAKRSWLQPDGPIGNPYYGQSMASCGRITEK